jgi:hypothetical protein
MPPPIGERAGSAGTARVWEYLTLANLTHAGLRGARYDRATRWPAGFDPRAHGAILVAAPRDVSRRSR